MIQQPNNIEANQNSGLNMNDLDFEFMTKGDQIVETQDIAGRMQQNLTPEELQEMAELAPYAEKFMLLYMKSETGQLPSEQDADRLLAEMSQGMTPTNGQGVPPEQGSGAMVPQNMQTKRKVPSRPVEGQMPQNAPEMMSRGGEVDISGILAGPKPDWLKRALDPATDMTEDNESIKSITGSMDGRQILVPTIRMIDGKLTRFTSDEAFKMAREKEDYLVLPAKSDKEAEAYSKELSDEFGRRRFEFGKVTQGMAEGGEIPAGPVGVIDQPGADNSGVADDVPAESDGFVINAAAVRHAGLRDINDMIQGAIEYAKKQGIELDFGKTPVDAEQILVSNGEVVIPDVIAKIIGYDKLEKINNRGNKETEKKLAEQEQQPPQQQAPAMQQQPVMQAAKGVNVQEVIGRYAGPFPAEDELIQEEVRKDITPYSSEDADYIDMDRIKEVYSLHWNPETKVKKRGQKQRDYTPGSNWMTHLDKGGTYELQPGIAENIREVMPAFDYELKQLGMYNPEVLEYFAKIESKGGTDLENKKTKDYGVFQINMANAKKYFTKDTEFKKFLKFYGKKAAALTGVSAYTLREIYLDNPNDFKELMLQSPKINLAVGLAMTLLPNMWETERKKNLDK